jgi:uncharacterized membrane protein YdfJ with MMPL/SSD domain
VIVFGAFAFTSVSTMQMLGVGLALAVIFDALFIRMALLPAAMCYLGKACWWWPRLLRRESRGGVRAAAAPPAQRLAKDRADA